MILGVKSHLGFQVRECVQVGCKHLCFIENQVPTDSGSQDSHCTHTAWIARDNCIKHVSSVWYICANYPFPAKSKALSNDANISE